MQVRFHPEARLDFKQAAEVYAKERAKLGHDFYLHIDRLVADITAAPGLFRVFRQPKARRHFRRPFPYAVVYMIVSDHVWVLAVMHFKQPPDYWTHRLND